VIPDRGLRDMSRIGKKPIPIPDGTTVTISGNDVTAKGPNGTLAVTVNDKVDVAVEDGSVVVKNISGLREDRKFHGLYRSLINNIVTGVSEGFTKKLEMVGVGYRANIQGKEIILEVGYSNPVHMKIPDGVKASVEKSIITLWGPDKQVLGQFAAEIRATRPPEPYKGKGIRYTDEHVRRKAGKAGAVGQGAV
jgi:large subunit ribosomal protein L6